MKTLDPKLIGRPDHFAQWLTRRGKTLSDVRLTCEDGERIVKMMRRGKNATASCTYTARTVLSFNPSRVEAIDGEGAVLGTYDFPDPDAEDSAPPGYIKEEADTNDERLLKTFAHLLADAHKLANEGLAKVVGMQAEHHAEERKALSSSLFSIERTIARMARLGVTPRVRVSNGEGDDDDEGEAEGNDAFAAMLTPLVARAVAGMTSTGGPATSANGKPPKGDAS